MIRHRRNRCFLSRLASITALVIALIGMAAPRTAAADAPAAAPSPQEQALQGLDLVLKGLRGMVEQVPLYGPPEVLPNGDIILRRISPSSGQPTPPPLPPTPGQRM